MHGSRGVPAADENEQADEKGEQAKNSQVGFGSERFFSGRRKDRRFKLFTSAGQLVVHLRPQARTIQTPSDLRSSRDRGAIDRQQNIAKANTGSSRGGIGGNSAGWNAVVGVEPGNSVVDDLEAAALIKVN